jgi:hypothetical protein
MDAIPDDVFTARLVGGPADGLVFEVASDQVEITLAPMVMFGAVDHPDANAMSDALRGATYRYTGELEVLADPAETGEGDRRPLFTFVSSDEPGEDAAPGAVRG